MTNSSIHASYSNVQAQVNPGYNVPINKPSCTVPTSLLCIKKGSPEKPDIALEQGEKLLPVGLLNGIRMAISSPSNATFGVKRDMELDNLTDSGHNAAMSQSSQTTHNGRAADHGWFARSYAKVNLTLDVLGRRADGYHELLTVMQTIDVYDTVYLAMQEQDEVHMACTAEGLAHQDNLAARAAHMVRERLSLAQGLTIELDKRIPVAAGLGGGSGNAATVLQALRTWLRLPLTAQDLQTMAATLGSDVPFFLTGGLALCEGRGERITPLTYTLPASLRWLLLLKPAIELSTATIFRNLTTRDYSDGSASRAALAALAEGKVPALETLHNGLERGVLENYAPVARAREDMLQAGAPFVRLSGSGPTLFALFSDLSQANQVRQRLLAQGYEVYLTRPTYPQREGDV